jgi:hypothetical protein
MVFKDPEIWVIRCEEKGLPSPMDDANTGDLTLFCHVYCLLFFYNGIVRKLIPGDPAPPSFTRPTILFALEFT